MSDWKDAVRKDIAAAREAEPRWGEIFDQIDRGLAEGRRARVGRRLLTAVAAAVVLIIGISIASSLRGTSTLDLPPVDAPDDLDGLAAVCRERVPQVLTSKAIPAKRLPNVSVAVSTGQEHALLCVSDGEQTIFSGIPYELPVPNAENAVSEKWAIVHRPGTNHFVAAISATRVNGYFVVVTTADGEEYANFKVEQRRFEDSISVLIVNFPDGVPASANVEIALGGLNPCPCARLELEEHLYR